MGRPSDTLLSAIKWLDFLASFLMLSIGCCVCVALMINPIMLMTPPIMIGIIAFGAVIPLLFKTLEVILIQAGLHESWSLTSVTMILGICFIGLFLFSVKSYISIDTYYAIKDNIPKIKTCIESILKEEALGQIENPVTQLAKQSDQIAREVDNTIKATSVAF